MAPQVPKLKADGSPQALELAPGANLGIFNAAYPLGGVIGVFFTSPVADNYGQRTAIGVGAGLCCIGAAIQAGAVNLPMFVIFRVVVGAASVLVGGVGAPLITEIAHSEHRSTATALFLTFYSLGAISAAWCTFGTFRIDGSASWRIPSALQVLSSAIQLITIWFVPESPRCLVSKGRNEEALTMLTKYHGEGDAGDPVVLFEYHEITTALKAEEEMAQHTYLGALKEFVTNAGNRRRPAVMVWAAICS
ncbi:hypothetical protein V2G26_001738 [Clonostachys chloroleuca]